MPNCYACGNDHGQPRPNSPVPLCDLCHRIDITVNRAAVEDARRQLGKVG
ncbi:MAG: hypothetical protein ACYDDN_02575 [Candidatus Desulforudaceae bacterium]